jgi:hypothetical protein
VKRDGPECGPGFLERYRTLAYERGRAHGPFDMDVCRPFETGHGHGHRHGCALVPELGRASPIPGDLERVGQTESDSRCMQCHDHGERLRLTMSDVAAGTETETETEFQMAVPVVMTPDCTAQSVGIGLSRVCDLVLPSGRLARKPEKTYTGQNEGVDHLMDDMGMC